MPKRQTWLISRKLLVIFVTIPTTSAILLPLLVIDRNFKPEVIFVTPTFHLSLFFVETNNDKYENLQFKGPQSDPKIPHPVYGGHTVKV